MKMLNSWNAVNLATTFSGQNKKMMNIKIKCLCRAFITLTLMTLMTACSAIGGTSKNDMVGVGTQSLNYSGKEVSYLAVEKPGEPNGGGGGDALNPYSGGGTICCFSIPAKWHPELKVVIEYQFYPEKEYRKQTVSVPPYAAGKAGDIWLIVHSDESVEAVVSDFGPTRAEWPGKVKGYPVPSREYRLKLWEEKLQREKDTLAAMEKGLHGDISHLTPDKINDLKEAIQNSKQTIKQLEGRKP